MNCWKLFSSHRPSYVAVQQIDTDGPDDVIEIEDSNDSDRFVTHNSNPYVVNQSNKENVGVEIVQMAAEDGEIMKEEYQLNDKYDAVQMDKIVYVNPQPSKEICSDSSAVNENQKHVHSLTNRQIDTHPSTNLLQLNNNTLLNGKPTNQLAKRASKILYDAIQLLETSGFAAINREVDSTRDDSSHCLVFADIEESDVDSDVMIDLTLDVEGFDEGVTYEIESSGNEVGTGQKVAPKDKEHQKEAELPNEVELPKKQKRKRKRKALIKPQNKKRKTANDPKDTKEHKCALCHYSTSNKWHLVQHLGVHDRPLVSFHCSICRREFSREKAWTSHEVKCKRGLRLYECHLCKEIAHNKNHLRKHMRAHTGKIYRCPKCKKQFASRLGRTQHMKSHAELFAFKCQKCRQVFSSQDKWKSHENRCKQKQYKCNICDRIVANTAHLKYHMQTSHPNARND